jgi:hypothetical protein
MIHNIIKYLCKFYYLRAYIPGLWNLYLKTRPYNVICKDCLKGYQSIGNVTQGDKCASNTQWVSSTLYLQTHYGSDLDGNRYKFIDELEAKHFGERDPICDECIKLLIAWKAIEQIPGNYLFGLLDLTNPEEAKALGHGMNLENFYAEKEKPQETDG